jgi:hypothetical protein
MLMDVALRFRLTADPLLVSLRFRFCIPTNFPLLCLDHDHAPLRLRLRTSGLDQLAPYLSAAFAPS